MIRQWDRNGFDKPSPHGRLVLLSFPDIIGPFQPAILPSPVQGDLPRASWRGKRPGAAAFFSLTGNGKSSIYNHWLVVFRHPSKKWWSESQLGWLFHSQYDGKIKKIPNHQSDQLQLILRDFPTYQSWDLKVEILNYWRIYSSLQHPGVQMQPTCLEWSWKEPFKKVVPRIQSMLEERSNQLAAWQAILVNTSFTRNGDEFKSPKWYAEHTWLLKQWSLPIGWSSTNSQRDEN